MSRYSIGPDIDLDQEEVRDRAGRRITERRAREIAEDTLEQARRGRPSLTGESDTSPRVSFRVPEQLRIRVERQARQEGRSVSEVARAALERYLSNPD
jgi:hypothetical protein